MEKRLGTQTSIDTLYEHEKSVHVSAQKHPTNDSQPRKPLLSDAKKTQSETLPPSGHPKRPLSSPGPLRPTRTLSAISAIGELNLDSDDITIFDASEDDRQTPDLPRKRLATGDGISAGSASPLREQSPGQLQQPPRRSNHKGRSNSVKYGRASSEPDDDYEILRKPETRPISQEQLVTDVKGIYAGLIMDEARCIEVDGKHATLAQADPGSQPKLNNEQWQVLIALHRTLLHEHYDFFLTSQHPSASIALGRLASKYEMPARMWRHGIHSFLELLRHRLPASLDHMLAFIYLAYSIIALLYETVPAHKDTWIECLGDLARYRMVIEDDDNSDRKVWAGVARNWYSKASDEAPTTGRLYQHTQML